MAYRCHANDLEISRSSTYSLHHALGSARRMRDYLRWSKARRACSVKMVTLTPITLGPGCVRQVEGSRRGRGRGAEQEGGRWHPRAFAIGARNRDPVPIEVCFETSMIAMRSQRKPIEVAEPSLRARLDGFDAMYPVKTGPLGFDSIKHDQARRRRVRTRPPKPSSAAAPGAGMGCVQSRASAWPLKLFKPHPVM